MKIHVLPASGPSSELAAALERFEASFRYPLGGHGHFRVSHGRDYLPFFVAMGEARVLVAERDGEVLGTLAGIPRPLRLASGETQEAVYLCDCKTLPSAGRVLLALAQAMIAAFTSRVAGRAYGVVMDGTPRLPSAYTGRCGLPGFAPLAAIRLFRFDTAGGDLVPPQDILEAEVLSCQKRHRPAAVIPLGGDPFRRSLAAPRFLSQPDGSAAGILEDTRAGKRLIADDGREMRHAHLSRFSFATSAAGAGLIRQALPLAAMAGFDGLFTAMPESGSSSLREALGDLRWTEATATVYGHGLPAGADWEISTSEI